MLKKVWGWVRNMRCRVKGCNVTRRGSIKKALCWSKYQLCTKHAVEQHPEDYSDHFITSMEERYEIKALRKPKKVLCKK